MNPSSRYVSLSAFSTLLTLKGTINSSGALTFEEYEVTPNGTGKAPIMIPLFYTGNVSGSSGEGKCGPGVGDMKATFKLTL